MITITTTLTLDGQTPAEYQKIVEYFNTYGHEQAGYTLIKEPLINKITAVRVDKVESL